MYVYNVTVKVEAQRADEWLTYMKQKHLIDVMATKYFVEYRLCRLLDDTDLDGVTFVIQYVCKSIDDFLMYKTTNAPVLQKDHLKNLEMMQLHFALSWKY